MEFWKHLRICEAHGAGAYLVWDPYFETDQGGNYDERWGLGLGHEDGRMTGGSLMTVLLSSSCGLCHTLLGGRREIPLVPPVCLSVFISFG